MPKGGTLLATVHDLAPTVAAALLSGREVTVGPWYGLVEQHAALTVDARGMPLEPAVQAAGLLARIICTPVVAEARSLTLEIPDRPECEFAHLIAAAVVQDRAVRADPAPARPHAELASCLYALMPKYHGDLATYIAGSLRVLSETIAFLARAEDASGALGEVSTLTAGASQLASRYGVYRDVEAAAEFGERSLAANRHARGPDALGVWSIANNLANLHIALAQDHPAAGPVEYERASACVDLALAAVARATGDVRDLRETAQRKQEQLRSVREPDNAEHEARAAAAQIEYLLAAQRIEDRPQRAASLIIEAEDGPAGRRRAAAHLLAVEYGELAGELGRIVASVGFDGTIGKLLLALGAIASGRLGELTGELVQSWLITPAMPQDKQPWTAYRTRQYLPTTGEHQADRSSALGRIIELASVVDEVERRDPGVGLRTMLRAHNTDLFARLVRGTPVVQEHSAPALSRTDDLSALHDLVQRIFRGRPALPPD